MHPFNSKPLGLRLGSRNGIVYVYQITKLPPVDDSQNESNDKSDQSLSKQNLSKAQKKLGIEPQRSSSMQYKLAKNRYDKLLSLLGRIILKIQDIDVSLHTLDEVAELIEKEKTPLYITFGETIENFEDIETKTFNFNLHSTFFKSMFLSPPTQYCAMDVQRMTLLFFSLFALDLLYDLDKFFDTIKESKKIDKKDVIEWIYAQQIISNPDSKVLNQRLGGLRGGSFLGIYSIFIHFNYIIHIHFVTYFILLCILYPSRIYVF